MCKNAKAIPAETSMRITALRFLLIVLVVFIHNNLRAEDILKGALVYGYTPFAYENGLFGRWVQIFISGGIANCAVPLFFMFASYLQFMKGDSYGVLLKKKAKSLLVPYFLWPLLNIGIYVGFKLLVQAVFPAMIERKNWFPMSGWGVKGWLHAFFGYENMAEGRICRSALVRARPFHPDCFFSVSAFCRAEISGVRSCCGVVLLFFGHPAVHCGGTGTFLLYNGTLLGGIRIRPFRLCGQNKMEGSGSALPCVVAGDMESLRRILLRLLVHGCGLLPCPLEIFRGHCFK